MAMIKQDFEMWQGEDKRITFTVVDSSGSPKSLVGSTVEWILSVSPTQNIIKSTTLNNIIIVNNKAQVILDGVDTVPIRAGKYTHECRVTDTTNLSEVVAVGTVTINSSKTR